jgi:hypothetical protein
MTLSAFLRDYLYVPLGGSRHGPLRRYTNLIVTMLLGGLWHGAGWTFVVWGAFHGVGLAICHGWNRLSGGRIFKSAWLDTCVARGLTLLFVIFGWVLFRSDSMSTAMTMMSTMVGLNGFDLTVNADRRLTAVLTLATIGLLFGIALFAPNSQQWLGYDPDEPAENKSFWSRALASRPLHGVALGVLFTLTLTQMSAVQSFLYFQF